MPNTTTNVMSYGDAAKLLKTFLRASPYRVTDKLIKEAVVGAGLWQPKLFGIAVDPLLLRRNKLYVALLCGWGDFETCDFWQAEDPITDALWYTNSTKTNALTAPPKWSLDDTMSSVGMLAFALPEGGAVISAGIGAAQKLVDNASTRTAYYEKLGQGGNPPESAFVVMQRELEAFMVGEDISKTSDSLMSQVKLLQASMDKMLIDPADVTNTRLGFRTDWLNANNSKYTALGKDDLGAVWKLIESNAFNSLVALGHPKKESPATASPLDQPLTTLKVIDAPSKSMCTIDAYCKVITVVVKAIVLYAEICLMPEEALRPGWNPATFDARKAMQSPVWTQVPAQCKKSARDCWEYIWHHFDPNSDELNCMTRLDPVTGDAARAFDLIKKRLDRISFNSGLDKRRDGFLFLEASKAVDIFIPAAHSGDSDVSFSDNCLSTQSEIKDTAISSAYSTAVHDDFIEEFRHFQTTLTMNWYRESASDAGGKFWEGIKTLGTGGYNAFSALQLRKDHPWRNSPWREGAGDSGIQAGGYDQVCWGPDVIPTADPKGAHTLMKDGVLFMVQYNVVESYGYASPAFQDGFIWPQTPGDLSSPQGFMTAPLNRAVIAWYSFVLKNYAQVLNYKIDPDAGTSLIDSVQVVRTTLTNVYRLANKLVNPIDSANPSEK